MSVFEILDFYEHVALLIKKDHLDIYDVWHTFYEWLQPVYFDLLPILDDKEGQWVLPLLRPLPVDGPNWIPCRRRGWLVTAKDGAPGFVDGGADRSSLSI